MNKKKLLVTMIALALSASSVACGAQKVEPAKNNNIESEAPAEDTSSESSSEAASEDASSEESNASASSDSISGVVNGTTYENKYFGVKFALGDNFKFANDEELQTLNSTITDLDAFEKLRDINFSLDNEKSLSTYFKRINKENNINNALKENSRNRSKKSTKYSQEMTVQSTNSNYDNIFYPNVYYINEDKNLHTKTHVSMLFSNLKNML